MINFFNNAHSSLNQVALFVLGFLKVSCSSCSQVAKWKKVKWPSFTFKPKCFKVFLSLRSSTWWPPLLPRSLSSPPFLCGVAWVPSASQPYRTTSRSMAPSRTGLPYRAMLVKETPLATMIMLTKRLSFLFLPLFLADISILNTSYLISFICRPGRQPWRDSAARWSPRLPRDEWNGQMR